MSKNKKYVYTISQEPASQASASCWVASIIRQVSSNKTMVSKSQSGFKTKIEAKKWAEAELELFQQTQTQRNSRKNKQRKNNQEQRESRSNRRAVKTAAAKMKNLDSSSKSSSTTSVWEKRIEGSQTENSQTVKFDNISPDINQQSKP